jgi:hypothetical protein
MNVSNSVIYKSLRTFLLLGPNFCGPQHATKRRRHIRAANTRPFSWSAPDEGVRPSPWAHAQQTRGPD